jgi:hypothetical protein
MEQTLAFCFVAGYFLAGLWSSARDTSPLAQICARVDYVNGLQENLKGQEVAVCRQSISDSWLGNLRECLAHLV